MTRVEVRIAKPGWQYYWLCHWSEQHCVTIAAFGPLFDTRVHVMSQSCIVSAPHLRRWMVGPLSFEQLHRFNALLAETSTVKAGNRCLDIW